MLYEYTTTERPCINSIDYKGNAKCGILYDITVSAMTDKDVRCIKWDEPNNNLMIYRDTELSSGDKTILDGIVTANATYVSNESKIDTIEVFDPKSPDTSQRNITINDSGVLTTTKI